MIICDECGGTEIVWEDNGVHLCQECDEARRTIGYEEYKKTYGSDPDRHRLIRGLIPCKLCEQINNCECHYCMKHCLKSLDNLKDKDLFIFSRREK